MKKLEEEMVIVSERLEQAANEIKPVVWGQAHARACSDQYRPGTCATCRAKAADNAWDAYKETHA